MSRKLVAGVVALAAGVLAVWLLVHHRGGAKLPPPSAAAKKPILPAPGAAATRSDEAAPRGRAPEWTLDADPEGPLRLEGQVVDGSGQGVGGVEVWLSSVPARSAKTEGDGSFAFDHLVGREYVLTASHDALVGGPVTYKLTATSDPVVIALRTGVTIDVTVSDEQKQPISGADVRVPGDGERSARTDDHGKATLAGVAPGFVAIEASASGYAPASTLTSIGSAGGKGTVALTLRRGAAVSGRVVDESGRPLAKVHVTDRDGPGWGGKRAAGEQMTDEQGRFQFPALAPGSHTLAVADGEHAPATSSPITVAAERPVSGVQIVMKAGAVVRGVVVEPTGGAVRFATVRISGKGAEMWAVAARQATTDDQGRFELRGLPRTKLQARAESDTAASEIAELDTSTRAHIDDVKLVLDVKGTISGVVVDEAGQPVPEVEVNAFPDVLAGASIDGLALAGMSSSTTDGAGRFLIHGLPDGAYRLWAARHATMEEGWGKQSTPAKAGDQNVRIVMPAPGVLVGRIALENGNAPQLAYVQLGMQPATPANDGAFRIEDVAPGTHDLRVFGPEFTEQVRRDVKIDAGKTTDLGTLTVLRGRRLEGRVVDASGEPVAGATVKLGEMLFSSGRGDDSSSSMDDLAGIRTAVTDQDGSFELTGVPAKATTVIAEHPDRGQSLPVPVAAGTDDPPPVQLALRGFGSITGKVVQKGEPVPNVTISEATKGGGAQAAFVQSAADGTFTMPKVAEGTHVLSAIQPGMMTMKSTSVTVQVTAGRATQVTIDIPVGTLSLAVQVQALPGNKVDAAQVFLFSGTVNMTTGKQLTDGVFQGSMQGMKFWFGAGKPQPVFDELTAGSYSVCTIPITGDLTDPTFLQRVQENVQTLAVYCKPVTLAASPNQQTFVDEVPAMTPLPAPKT